MKGRIWITGALVAISWAVAPPLRAQFSEYTLPGSLAELPQDRKDEVKKAAEKARWRVGPFRVEPWYGVRDMAWVDDQRLGPDGEPLGADFTTTVGVGARAYLRTGPKATWAFHALPEYVYWKERTGDRRSLGRFGAGLFADFNRLAVEVTASRLESDEIALAESFSRFPIRADEAYADLELKLSGAFSVFAGGTEARVRWLANDERGAGQLTALDRDESAARAGVRLRSRSGFLLGLGYEKTEAAFLDPAFDRSNTGDAIFLELRQRGGQYAVEARIARRQLEASQGSTFVAFDDVVGSIQLQLRPEGRLSPVVYASRDLQVALGASASYVVEDRLGASLRLMLGRRTGLAVFYEQGEQEYRSTHAGLAARRDDLAAYGVTLTMELGRGLAFGMSYGRTRYDSVLDGLDRETTVLRAGLSVGASGSGWY